MRQRHEMPFGAVPVDGGGVRFSVWAPSVETIDLEVDGVHHLVPRGEGGWHSTTVADARPGSRYVYRVGDDVVPDPASRFQPDDVKGASAVVDPTDFLWGDRDWRGRPWEDAVIYEVHVGTVTRAGTYAALADRLPGLRDLGVTAVELMPIGEFHGRRNWGYDGVLPYAPDASYGTPNDLKALVDRAHELGMMMLLDVVYNHFGPVGNHLSKYAKNFFTDRHKTPWGDGLNFDGRDGRPVREYFIHNALYWLDEFHFDGLRFDAVHAIQDDSTKHMIAELAERARSLGADRHIHLILENERNQARWLGRGEGGKPSLHTAQWCDDIHHCWHVLLTGETEGYYEDFAADPVGLLARCLSEGFAFQGELFRHTGHVRGEPSGHLPPSAFVSFLQNHDQVGNRAFGDRLAAEPEKLSLARAGLLLAPQIPMLFMGEEWGATAPFQFFVDFSDDPDLSRAVRNGRRREFQHFAAFQGEKAEAIPDPTAEDTFRNSTVDQSEMSRAPHDAVLAETRELLAIRHERIVPLTKTGYLGAVVDRPSPASLDVAWRFGGGALRLAANFGDEPVQAGTVGEVIWMTPERGGEGEPAGSVTLPPWSLVVSIEDGR